MHWKILLAGALSPMVLALFAADARAQAMLEFYPIIPLRPGEGARVVFASPPGPAESEDHLSNFNFWIELSGNLDATCRQTESYVTGTSFAAPSVQYVLDAASTRLSLDDGGGVVEIDLDPCFAGQPVAVLMSSPIPPADASGASPPMPVALGAAIFGPDDRVRAVAGGGIANFGTLSLQNGTVSRIWPGRTLVIPWVGPGQAAEVYLAPRSDAADAAPSSHPGFVHLTITLQNTSSADCTESIPLALGLEAGANTLRLEKDGAVLWVDGEEVLLSESCLHGAPAIDFELNQSADLTATTTTSPTAQLPTAVVLGYAITEPGETVSVVSFHFKSKGITTRDLDDDPE